jgi:uncharacterized membrane protein (TIGR02234 family)
MPQRTADPASGLRARGRRWFGPTVLLGVVGSGVSAFAGGRAWAAPDTSATTTLVDRTGGHVPLAAALGLVGLAGWGVVLVTRRWLRRAVAVLGVLVAVGLVATAVAGRGSALDSARQATVDLGTRARDAHTTVWWYVALVAAVVALYAATMAVRHVGSWPEMGSRYDAPVTRPEAQDPVAMEGIDLWRAIDQGRDPTDPINPTAPTDAPVDPTAPADPNRERGSGGH